MRTDHSNDPHNSLHEDPDLLRETFNALATYDPELGRILATVVLTGISAAHLEQRSIEAVDLDEGVIEPVWYGPFHMTSHRCDLPVLPICDAAAPLVARIVEHAAAKRCPTIIAAATTLRRWRRVRELGRLGVLPRHSFRELFAATLGEATTDPSLITCSLGKWPEANGVRHDVDALRPVFEAIADRLAPLVLRPEFTEAPG